MDPAIKMLADRFCHWGLSETCIHFGKKVNLPGFFRPEKKWDLVVVHDGSLVAAIEVKGIAKSFGKNLSNRVEEVLGSAVDLQHAAQNELLGYRPPWIGYALLMQDDIHSKKGQRRSVTPHFDVDEMFIGADYQARAQILLRRLLMERIYDAAWFLTINPAQGRNGISEPAVDLTWSKFDAAIKGRVGETLA